MFRSYRRWRFLLHLPSSTQGFPTSTATPLLGSADSRGLRPLPPTPKREVVAQRILRCGKRNTQALYWFLLPDSFQMWFETTRFVYFVKLKHASRTFFDLRLQRTAFQSKNTPKKCSQSSPRAPKTSPKCLRELPGDVLRGHTHLPSGPGASPIRQSGQSVINSSKVEHPRNALGTVLPPF